MPPVDSKRDGEPQGGDRQYWRSLDQLADAPEFRRFMESEFPGGDHAGNISRRRWLQLMGASLALAGAGGCRWKKQEILPFDDRPPQRTPGVPKTFATAMDLGGSAIGLLATSYDGRPIKLEGNPAHPASLGATGAYAQAAVLELYDPDRSRSVVQNTSQGRLVQDWSKFEDTADAHFNQLEKTGGKRLRILTGASSSPTLARLRRKLLERFPQAAWYEYEPISCDAQREATGALFGKPHRVQLDLAEAQVIVCLEADLLGGHPNRVRYARDFAEGREVVDRQMNRLYAVESTMTLTGAAADHRLAMRSTDVAELARALRRCVDDLLSGGEPAAATDPFVAAMAKDLVAHRGRSVVAAGAGQPAEVHAAACRINDALENVGNTVFYTEAPDPERPSHVAAIRQLVDEINAGEVSTLLIMGGNPVFDAPADLDFAAALKKVERRIRLGLYEDETSAACQWHLPEAHFLESWGDARAWDGTYSVVQPLIEPLYDGRSAIELVASLAGQAADRADALVRQTCYEILGRPMPETPTEAEQEPDEGEAGEGAPAEAMAAGVLPADAGVEIPASPAFAAWRKVVVEGVLAGSAWPKQTPKVTADKADDVAKADEEKPADDESESDELEIVFTADASVYDGRFANSGWLQEMPDPMTRLTWDNAALLAPATAKRLGVSDGDLLRLKLGQRELTVPAYMLPGQAPNSVAVALGYGRTAAGNVGGSQSLGVEPVGANAYALRTTGAMHFGTGLEIEPTGETYPLASVQNHHAIDTVGQEGIAKRLGQLLREATLAYYVEHPEFAKHKVHHPPLESLWDEPSFDGRRWGMSIDLSKCIGCGACVVACQAENNIPIVGKQRVSEGREMHWLRIDRYFRGPAEEPQVAHQPVACQQCELAPCEQVCPVAATVHSKEGLNDMVYNRCVGTRYCANNCPYKVRRFNYFNYHTELKRAENEPVKMVYNPEVTIRSRGVMEKCTYCVQRIQNVKIDAKNQRRPIADGEIKTACQQACPAQAIEFGDLSDPKSNVRAAHEADRAYAVLEELNVKPRTRYLAKIRNPNPELQEPEHEHDSGHA